MTETTYDDQGETLTTDDQLAALEQGVFQQLEKNGEALERVAEVARLTGEQYMEAADGNDENGMNRAVAIYDHVNALGTQIAELNAQQAAAVKLATDLAGQKRQVVGELAELVEAIESADTDHPLVSDLVESVEEWAAEQAEMYSADWADESAVEDIATNNGLEWQLASRLYDAIRAGRFAEEIKALAAKLPAPFQPQRAKPYTPPTPSPADVDEEDMEDEDWSDEDDQDYDEAG